MRLSYVFACLNINKLNVQHSNYIEHPSSAPTFAFYYTEMYMSCLLIVISEIVVGIMGVSGFTWYQEKLVSLIYGIKPYIVGILMIIKPYAPDIV